jgi:hypothetical protein
MVSKPRKVIIDLDNRTVIVKTVMRAYQDKVDVTENLNVKAAPLRIASSVTENTEIPALSLTIIKDGVSLPMKLDNLATVVKLDTDGNLHQHHTKKADEGFDPADWEIHTGSKSEHGEKDSASQGHGWPGEDQGRDYGGLTSGSVTYRKRKRPRTAMDKIEEE